MGVSAGTPRFVQGEFELVGQPVGIGEVILSDDMAELARGYVAQELLPAIRNRTITELDDQHDLTEGAAGFSSLGPDGRMHRHVASLALHHGIDSWTMGVLVTDSLTGEVQHRKMKQYRIVASAGRVLEAYVQKRFIIDRADLDVESVLRHDNSVLMRKALEKALTDNDCWELLEHLYALQKMQRPPAYLGIPERLYPPRYFDSEG